MERFDPDNPLAPEQLDEGALTREVPVDPDGVSLKMDESGKVLACFQEKCYALGEGESVFNAAKELFESVLGEQVPAGHDVTPAAVTGGDGA